MAHRTNPPKHEIMTVEQMDEMNCEILNHSRLYDKETSNSEKVAVTVGAITDQLINAPMKKIALSDAETVRAVTIEYLKSCDRTGIIPSKIGLSRALGVTRAAVDSYIKHHPDSDTARFLLLMFDGFAEMLSMNSLAGSIHPIVSIFLQKALYGFRDNEPTEQPIDNSSVEELSPEQIAAKYADLPEE